MSRRWVLPLWTALGALLLAAAWLLINTTFMLYDDEGYVLATYQQFNAGRALYTEIFSQYGPWPYLYHWVVGAMVQSPVTHEVGRLLTAMHWVLGALGAGWIAMHLTAHRGAALATTMAAFGLLWQMSSEPAHPGGLIVLTLVVSVILALSCWQAGRWRTLGAVLGGTSALLVLTKVNVGLLFLTGTACVLLHCAAWPASWRHPARLIGTAGLLAAPWVLMGPRLAETWVLAFAVTACLALVAVPGVLRWDDSPVPLSCVMTAAGAFVAIVGLIAIAVWSRGTPPGALWHAVFVAPLQHPTSFMVGLPWPPGSWLVAAVSAGLAVRAGLKRRKTGELTGFTRRLILLIRLGTVGVFLWHAALWPTLTGVSRFLMWGLSLVPVFLVSAQRGPETREGVRFLVACLALPQVLHAYPVAGSQMGWGSFLLLPLFAAGLHDAWLALAEDRVAWRSRIPSVAWGVVLVATGAQVGLLVDTGWTRYAQSRPVGLPGAATLRPGDDARLTMRLLTLNAVIHAERLFSYPGMYSYNLWSGVPTPTQRNATHWFWLLGDAEQQAIIDVLQATPRTAIINNHGFDEYLKRQQVPVRGPLRPWLRQAYRPLLRHGSFEFLVPNASAAVPFGIAELLVPAGGAQTEFPALIQTNVVLQGRPARFELREIIHPWRSFAAYSPPRARILIEPISREGRALGTPVLLPLDGDLRGLFRVQIYTPEGLRDIPLRAMALTGLDAAGNVLCESVF